MIRMGMREQNKIQKVPPAREIDSSSTEMTPKKIEREPHGRSVVGVDECKSLGAIVALGLDQY